MTLGAHATGSEEPDSSVIQCGGRRRPILVFHAKFAKTTELALTEFVGFHLQVMQANAVVEVLRKVAQDHERQPRAHQQGDEPVIAWPQDESEQLRHAYDASDARQAD